MANWEGPGKLTYLGQFLRLELQTTAVIWTSQESLLMIARVSWSVRLLGTLHEWSEYTILYAQIHVKA